MRLASVFAVIASVACGGACGGAVRDPVALPLANTTTHAPTAAERQAALCARSALVALEPTVLADVALATDSGSVRSVSVRDAQAQPVEVPAETLAPVRVGHAFTMDGARDATRRLWMTGKFDDVVVETTREGEGVVVVFRVVPKRTIANVFGAETDAAAELHLAPGAVYDPVALVSARHSVVDDYVQHGHPDAKLVVSSDFADADHRTIDVCVRVDRGPKVTLDAITVRGSAFDQALAAVIAREDTVNVRGAVLDESVLERDVLLVTAYLYDQGLVTNKIEKTIDRVGDTQRVTLAVTDGPVYRYSSIDVRGDFFVTKADYMKLVTAKKGDVFNRTSLVKMIDDFRAIHKAGGREDIEIDPMTDLDAAKNTVAITIDLRDPKKVRSPVASASGFSIVELAPGAGRAAKKGDHVSVHYKGTLPNGTVFDSSVGRSPFQFTVGGGQVIAGFDRGVAGMKIGGKRRVTIPPDLGYGARGAPPSIPPNSILVFELELVAIQ